MCNCKKAWGSVRGKIKEENGTWERVDFLRWCEKKEKKCHYCGIPENNFIEIWGEFYGGRRGHRLEIERKDNNSNYIKGNCVLACAICNCAKTDKFTHKEFLKVGEVIRKIWEARARIQSKK